MLAAAARRAVRTTGLKLASSTAARSFSSLGSGLAFNSATPYNVPLIRSFGSKKSKKPKGDGDKGVVSGGGTKVMLINVDEGDYFEKPVKDMFDLMKKLAKAYHIDSEEITEGGYTLQVGEPFGLWEDLKDFQQIKEKAEKEGNVPHVRIKELDFDEEDYDEDLGGDDDYMGDDYFGDKAVSAVIGDLIRELREAGWNRPDAAGLLKKESGEELAAREYILQSAKENAGLRDMLVSQIGAMDHILQCLQYEFLWEDPSLDHANDMGNDSETLKDAEFTEK